MIQYLEYKSKKYPVKLGYKALKHLKAENIDLSKAMGEDGANIDYEVFEPVLFHALEQGHSYVQKTNPFKREDMEDVLEDCLFDFVAMIPAFFQTPPKPGTSKTVGVSGKKK